MSTAETITVIIATYGAILSTVAIAWQIMGDRIKVKLTVQRNMEIIGDPRYKGMTLTIFKVTNVGRRPVTITTFGAIRLHPHTSFVAIDSEPKMPCEITDGKSIVSKWDQKDLDFSIIDYWAAWDSHDNLHKLQEASWFRHWKSTLERRRSSRKHRAKPSAAK